METPPRAWGRRGAGAATLQPGRNTPTGVGTTCSTSISGSRSWKHPHGRGDDPTTSRAYFCAAETPPRAWGRRTGSGRRGSLGGNTPTGVGTTRRCRMPTARSWKHPHGRGDDPTVPRTSAARTETPPRAWGRLLGLSAELVSVGNTPTGVGTTSHHRHRGTSGGKHPHGRGDDFVCALDDGDDPETPPRAWGRPRASIRWAVRWRNTPTGVGTTVDGRGGPAGGRKHPHGRGDDSPDQLRYQGDIETPPRAWGRPVSRVGGHFVKGNTPTGVGTTSRMLMRRATPWKHPHGRGDDYDPNAQANQPKETPPRAWGRLEISAEEVEPFRNTPTGVGTTRP